MNMTKISHEYERHNKRVYIAISRRFSPKCQYLKHIFGV